MRYFFILIILGFSLSSCSQQPHVSHLNNLSDFKELQGKSLNTKFSNTESVKVVFDVKKEQLYFLNSDDFTFHHEFCSKVLRYQKGLGTFNQECYNNKSYRGYLLGNIVHVTNTDVWVLELAASDKMQPKFIQILFNEIKRKTFFGENLKFYLNTQRLMNSRGEKLASIPCVKADYLFQNITSQSIEQGETIGILKKYDLKNEALFNPSQNEVILINSIPDYLPQVKGVIITELVTPLSHLVILAKNRNIPLYADLNAWENEKLNRLIDEKIKYVVEENRYVIEASSDKIKNTRRKKIRLSKNVSEKRIIDLNKNRKENYDLADAIGAKAQNLFYLKVLQKREKTYLTPEHCFAVPFFYYEQHIKTSNTENEIAQLLKLPSDSIQAINRRLKKIRSLIQSSPVDKNMVTALSTLLNSQTEFAKFRFRSSTNCEDINGFNGAGLYDSKSAILGDSIKTIERAIKRVWASVWNERAFWEREIFGIKQQSVSMAVLVHRSFPDEVANGVLISKNLYRKYKGITVNAQHGEESVVEPETGTTCDEFYAYQLSTANPYELESSGSSLTIDYRSVSNLDSDKPVLTEKEIQILHETSLRLERTINRLWEKYQGSSKTYALDIEFKLEGESRQFYFKQVRPYLE